MFAILHWTGASHSGPYQYLNTREGRPFVIGQVEDGIEADHLQEHDHAFGRRKIGGFAAGALQRGEGANQSADAGTVEFGDAGEIDGDARGAAVNQFLDFVAECLFGIAQFQGAIKIQDGGVTSFTNADIHMSLTAVAKLTELGPPIKAAV